MAANDVTATAATTTSFWAERVHQVPWRAYARRAAVCPAKSGVSSASAHGFKKPTLLGWTLFFLFAFGLQVTLFLGQDFGDHGLPYV